MIVAPKEPQQGRIRFLSCRQSERDRHQVRTHPGGIIAAFRPPHPNEHSIISGFVIAGTRLQLLEAGVILQAIGKERSNISFIVATVLSGLTGTRPSKRLRGAREDCGGSENRSGMSQTNKELTHEIYLLRGKRWMVFT